MATLCCACLSVMVLLAFHLPLSLSAFPGAFIWRSFISIGGVFDFEVQTGHISPLRPSVLDKAVCAQSLV